jgi:hypothetical protein
MLPPAEKRARAGFMAIAVAADTTGYSFPLNVTVIPTDFSEATGISSVTGKFRSSSILIMVLPTKPVAPTTATFMVFLSYSGAKILRLIKNFG